MIARILATVSVVVMFLGVLSIGSVESAELAPPVRLMAGGKPIDVGGFAAPFVGDFDGDGKNDLLVGQRDFGRMRVYRNLGNNANPKFDRFEWFTAGGHIAAVPRCCRTAFTPQLIDFDADGRTDLLTGSGWDGEIYLFRRNTDGTFAEAEVLEDTNAEVQMGIEFSGGRGQPFEKFRIQYNSSVFACDYNADGRLDLIIRNGVLLNRGSREQPVFDEPKPILIGDEPMYLDTRSPLQMVDFDGDGLDDLIVIETENLVWHRNKGTAAEPVFAAAQLLAEPGSNQPNYFHSVCVADFNADGRLDLLVGDSSVRRIENSKPIASRSTTETAVPREAYDKASEANKKLREAPPNETRDERIARHRALLRAWQHQDAAWQSRSGQTESHGNVWFYERLAP